MEYMKVSKAAEKWGISSRRIRVLCAEGKIPGVIRKGNLYMIPENAAKPADGRKTRKNKLENVDKKLKELYSLRPLTQGESKQQLDDYIVYYTNDSTGLAGNSLDLKETAKVLDGLTVEEKPLKDHLEAVGHRDALMFVIESLGKQLPFDIELIKNIHSLVLTNQPEDKGVLRRIPSNVIGSFIEPAAPEDIESRLTNLLETNEERKQTMNNIERIARFHLEFEGIHPFIDGNGRTGRLLLNRELMLNGYPAITIRKSDKKKYYDAFDAYYSSGDAMPMAELIAGYVDEEIEKYFKILK